MPRARPQPTGPPARRARCRTRRQGTRYGRRIMEGPAVWSRHGTVPGEAIAQAAADHCGGSADCPAVEISAALGRLGSLRPSVDALPGAAFRQNLPLAISSVNPSGNQFIRKAIIKVGCLTSRDVAAKRPVDGRSRRRWRNARRALFTAICGSAPARPQRHHRYDGPFDYGRHLGLVSAIAADSGSLVTAGG